MQLFVFTLTITLNVLNKMSVFSCNGKLKKLNDSYCYEITKTSDQLRTKVAQHQFQVLLILLVRIKQLVSLREIQAIPTWSEYWSSGFIDKLVCSKLVSVIITFCLISGWIVLLIVLWIVLMIIAFGVIIPLKKGENSWFITFLKTSW